jgi:hypothetical protein
MIAKEKFFYSSFMAGLITTNLIFWYLALFDGSMLNSLFIINFIYAVAVLIK